MRKFNLGYKRAFVSSLLQAAADAKGTGQLGRETTLRNEALGLLNQILTSAPQDEWAASTLQKTEQHLY